jgi:hypothetical protein
VQWFLIWEDSIMTLWRSAFSRRGAKRAWAHRASPVVERLEERNLLTSGLVVVPNPVGAGQNMFGAAALAANDIWGVGSNEFIDPMTGAIDVQPLAEHFNGASWSVVSTPAVPSGGVNPPDAQFRGVAAAASDEVWAVGFRIGPDNPDFGESLIEHWDGRSWSVVSSPTATVENTSLDGVAAISSNNGWAVGGNSGNALVEHWDGTNWTVVSNPAFTGEGNLSAISADASNDIWAAAPGVPGFLHFDGTSWSRVTSPNMEAEGITALSPTSVWAVGTVGVFINHHSFRQAAIEHWNGTSWSIVASPNPNPKGPSTLNGVASISANDIWAVGSIGVNATITEHWDGTSWSIIKSPNPAQNQNELFGVTALSDGTVAAVGHQEDVNTDQPLILQNKASAPKAPTAAVASPATMPPPLDFGPVMPTATMPATANRTVRVPLAAAVDQFFASTGNKELPLSVGGQRLAGHEGAGKGDMDALTGDLDVLAGLDTE